MRSSEEPLKRKSGTIHMTADSGNIELMMRTVHSANQLSVHGAVSSRCMHLGDRMQGQRSVGVNMSISE